MKLIIDEEFIEKKSKLAKRSGLIGMGLLLLSIYLVFALDSSNIYPLLTTIVGFVLVQVGVYNAVRWLKTPRPDEIITKSLKGLNNNYSLMIHTSPVAITLVSPVKVFAIYYKLQEGEIRCRGGRWNRPFTFTRILSIFEEGMGNPTRDAQREASDLRKLLAKYLSEEEVDSVPVEPVVVFTGQDAKLEVEGCDAVPVLTPKELKKHIRSEVTGSSMPGSLRRRVIKVLSGDVDELEDEDAGDEEEEER